MSMKLLVLGLLMERERHPYEIRKTIKERNWNECFKLRDGSLYYAVDKLRDDGLIEASEIVPVHGDNRPDKIIYRITERGIAAFHEELYGQLEQSPFPQHPMFLAMPFIRHGDPDEVGKLLAEQLAACEARIARLKGLRELKAVFMPRGSELMIEGFIAFSETERNWLAQLLEDARSGALFTGPKWPLEQIEAYLKKMGVTGGQTPGSV